MYNVLKIRIKPNLPQLQVSQIRVQLYPDIDIICLIDTRSSRAGTKFSTAVLKFSTEHRQLKFSRWGTKFSVLCTTKFSTLKYSSTSKYYSCRSINSTWRYYRRYCTFEQDEIYFSGFDLSTQEVRSVRRSHSWLSGTGRGSSCKWKLGKLWTAPPRHGLSWSKLHPGRF